MVTERQPMIVIDTSIKANPYPTFARMRVETPVCKVLYGATRSPGVDDHAP